MVLMMANIQDVLEKVKEIQGRLDRATLGPWEIKRRQGTPTSMTLCDIVAHGFRIAELGIDPDLHDEGIVPNICADAEFIASARDDIDWLLRSVLSLSGVADEHGKSRPHLEKSLP